MPNSIRTVRKDHKGDAKIGIAAKTCRAVGLAEAEERKQRKEEDTAAKTRQKLKNGFAKERKDHESDLSFSLWFFARFRGYSSSLNVRTSFAVP